MSRQHINAYRTKLAKLHAVSGSLNEGVISQAFGSLLEAWGRSHDLTLVQQWEGKGPRGNDIKVDGALVPSVLRVPFGYWEAKDSKDDLDKEIAVKIAAGYPDDNIIYENSVTAVLRQNGKEVDRAPLQGDNDALLALLNAFFGYERAEIAEFRKAAAQFRADLPQILEALRNAVGEAEKQNYAYAAAAKAFLDHAREAINPLVTAADVREMLIQHILTEEIFTSVFDNAQYHRENNVAKKLTELEGEFFTGDLRHQTTQRLRPYYAAIKSAAAATADRREKQVFLKKLYEDFYKVYNPKAADRLGVVYTPGEIVRFMIRGAEWLCERHFGKTLIDPQVEILDPATGTGTFIVELLEHFQGDPDRLRYKYENELHANEVAILPYYVANLNIEATYAAITNQYAEFPGLVFVDTLDNTAGLGIYKGHQPDMFGSFADENLERVKRQNERRISVIIGNPPYNAWQSDYNARNPNRPYKRVDERIGNTYRRLSNAQNTSALSDMYVRFYRWASDRLQNEAILAFVTNRNFIEKVAFDGFRKAVAEEFAEIWLMDLGGDVRANPRLSGTKHNVFGIQTGVTVAFMVRTKGKKKLALYYGRRPEEETAADKLAFLGDMELRERSFARLRPDAKGNWLTTDHPDWDGFLPLADPTAGPGDVTRPVRAIFRLSSNGAETRRDDWLWDHDKQVLIAKTRFLISQYEADRKAKKQRSVVKWDSELDKCFRQNREIAFAHDNLRAGAYRVYSRQWLYFDPRLNGRTFRLPHFYRSEVPNPTIAFRGMASEDLLAAAAVDQVFDQGLVKTGNGRTFGVARYRYIKSGERVDNITDWALKKFKDHYADKSAARGPISKDDIFAYVYAVLHDPIYRETYAADLRREFPRIPFYPDFARWADWGRSLLDLHIGYEKAKPAKLTRTDTPGKSGPIPKLKSEPENGVIVVDSETQLGGIPREAWTYRLGNRSAIDWVLDQHKEKKIKDPTVAAKFNTYRFADYKESMIDLLGRVVRVSVETVRITEEMKQVKREG